MKILIIRYHDDEKQTIGKFTLLDENNETIKEWHSLELPDKQNQRRVSRIPEGVYKARKHISPKFGNSLWIQNVPNRSEILIHKGNYHTDILGCILIGKDLKDINRDGYMDVTNSTLAINELMDLLKNIDGILVDIRKQ